MARLPLYALGASLLATGALGNCGAAQGVQQPCHAQAQGQGQASGCAPNAAFLVDPKTGRGACCPPVGHKYFWDDRSQTGSCCPDTTVGFDGYMCVEAQQQPQFGAPQNCGSCAGGPGANANSNINTNNNFNRPGPGSPYGPGNTNYNNNYNVNNPRPGNPYGPGYQAGPGNTNYNNNYNANNPRPGNPYGPGNQAGPGNTNYNNNYNTNNPGPGNPYGPGNPAGQGNPNYNVNNPGPGNPAGLGNPNYNANNPGPGDVSGAGNCVSCCGGSKADGTGGACDPNELSNGCTERVCPDVNGDTLGLKYGHCYRFKNPEGKALNKRDHGMQDYVWGGYYADIYQFRICRSTSDCARGEEISVNSHFYINDQMGRTSKSSPDTLFWIVELPGWHFGNLEIASSAVRFTARPWVGDSCGICLKGDGKGLGPVCPAGNPGIGFKENPRYCIPIIVEEVPCLEGDGDIARPGLAAPQGVPGHAEL